MPWNGSCVAFQLGVVFLLNTSIKRSGTHYRSTELLINCSPSTVLRDHYHSHMYSFVIAEKKKKWGINSLFRSIEGERLKTKRRRIALAEAKSNFCHTTSNEMEDTAPETLLVHINCLLRLLVIGTNLYQMVHFLFIPTHLATPWRKPRCPQQLHAVSFINPNILRFPALTELITKHTKSSSSRSGWCN